MRIYQNGFIFSSNDASELAEKMSYIIDNNEYLDNIRNESRKTYERYFSMEAFAERLEQELCIAKEQWMGEL